MIAAVAVVRKARMAKALAPILGSVVLLPVVLLGAAGGALMGGMSVPDDMQAAWGAGIPAEMDALYAEAAQRFGVPRPILAAVGRVECDHGRDPDCMTPNSAGAVGPMQFLPSTFSAYSWASGSAAPSILDPRDAVFAAAALLADEGAAGDDPRPALWAYNHLSAYVADVLAWAVAYGWRSGSRSILGTAVLDHPRISVRPLDRVDLEAEAVDTRVLSALLALATRHKIESVGPFTRHSYFVAGTRRPSNHVFGRAVDLPVVGEAPVSAGNMAARRLVVDALTLPPDIRPSEVLSPWDLRIGDAWSITDSHHGDHVHLGYDGGSGA